ncbi:TDT family transporter [Baekduia alba]|uniref:TDT family transporter n=1 Tax=Baekduia alba TaxID=2997333 RepID=UPI00234234B5|nr:TDT family transporter [Baekduia alba]
MSTIDLRLQSAHTPPARPGRVGDAIAGMGPNWFTCVMGTGIVANALMLLPKALPAHTAVATAVWVLATALLVLIAGATVAQWLGHRGAAAGHLANPSMAPAYGALSMAFLTVGSGGLLIGHDLIGMQAALALAWTCWSIGTFTGLAVAVIVTYMMITHHELRVEDALGSWLMPVVSPMVSAATGAALIGHLDPSGQAARTMLGACYAMFGLSLIASFAVLPLLWQKLMVHGPGALETLPTLTIVLGPLGQSITAANLLGPRAAAVVPGPAGDALGAFGLVYGLPVLGFALLWGVLVAVFTTQGLRAGMSFNMTWWSYTFPIGTVVTGTSQLAIHLGSDALSWLAVALMALLVAGWAIALAGTARGAILGDLLVPRGRPRSR